MKKWLAALLAALMLPACAAAETIVTSFYPIYLFTLNLTQGLEGVEVINLTAPDTGCLHDYQLQTGDMKKLAAADVFLINGAGMESYLSGVMEAFPELPVVNASDGVVLMCSDGMHIDHHDHDHEHSEYNPHVWLNVENAKVMVHNLADGLMAACPEHAEAINANRVAYLERLSLLDSNLMGQLLAVRGAEIITFHEAFAYFAYEYGLEIAAVINREPSDALSPRELAELVSTVKELGNPPLFVEPQYSDMAAQTIARETGAKVYTLDPVVTGPAENVPLTYFEDVMYANMQVLLDALLP